ncbi:serine hydrolase [Antarcticibacterium flavum]|uniref:Serine hydrolase n=1 Tax=Antarcticibacterium flavum TaxID=2058175 RepID=A0A5B7X188_9FLAO|nr:hypothetical protein [Antarcticibacterium sp. W02-3]QCY69020.1 serine hydrolase [Antarcticibacterium flavum]
MRTKNLLVIVLFFCLGLTFSQTPDKEVRLTLDKEISDSLHSKNKHSYSIELDSAQFVHGFINQKTVDVAVKILNPKGETAAQYDGPGRGNEYFYFETKSAGKYTVQVNPFEESQGRYSINLTKVEPLAKEPGKRISQYMTPYSRKDVPGAAVLVLKDDKILFQEAYGMANLTYQIPFEVSTPTNIGSTSKQFTAFAIQLLADRGKISLDDDIRKYFPEIPDFGNTVTIRHLLTHTSGYREFLNTLGMTGRSLNSPMENEMIFKILKNQPELQNEPGAEWNYNNTGYVLAAALVAKVTEVPFPEWMQKNVFQPLGMKNTIVRANQNEVVPGRSQGYNMDEDGKYQEVEDLGGAMGAGGIYTTLEDLAKWVRNFRDPKVGNAKIFKEMTTPFVLKNGDTTNYGLGLFIEEKNGMKVIHHGGADVAHRSMLMYYPDINAAVITQSNNANFDGNSVEKIGKLYFPEYYKEKENGKRQDTAKGSTAEFDYDVEKFDALTGRYELEVAPGFVLTFKRDEDRIYTQGTGQPEIDIKAVSDSVFHLQGVNAKVTFHLKENGSADSLTLHQNGNHIAKRITWDPDVAALKEFTGKFYSPEIETVYNVDVIDENLVVTTYQVTDKVKLSPTDKDSFGGEFPLAEVKFLRDDNGNIKGFDASNGRSRGIRFEKMKDLE